MVSSTSTRSIPATSAVPLLALLAGALAMGISPVFVRHAEIGPFASAFWRAALALPVLYAWSRLADDEAASRPDPRAYLSVVAAGLLFAGDLTFWHLAILHTSVANATFLATLAPVWVVLLSGLLLGEAVGRMLFLGLGFCLVGAFLLIGDTWSLAPGQLDGDLYGVLTSIFFGLYFLAVRHARRTFGSGRTLFLSTCVTAAILGLEALILEDALWPQAWSAVAALFALAWISHAGGQGLLAFALGYLRAAFSALVIFIEGVAAAAFGWILLGEALSLTQILGATAIFAGIAVARNARQ